MMAVIVYAVILLSLYILLVRSLRYRRLSGIVKAYGNTPLTPLTAQSIVRSLSMHDSPFIYTKALEFGLFRTYAIPSIARVLCNTGDLVTRTAMRVEETDLLLSEMVVWPLNSERSTLALARMNFLHAQYGRAISNDDLLYTLSVFILEPVKWMALYDYRPMHALEVEANFMLWKSIGERMEIDGIPDSFQGMKAWSAAYEEQHMVYAKQNEKLGRATLETFLRPAPNRLKGVGRQAAAFFMDDRLRRAFGFSEAPAGISQGMVFVLRLRAFVMRNLLLPRSTPYSKLRAHKTKDGLYRRTGWSFAPLYVKPTWINSLFSHYLGFVALGHGSKWHNEGYTLESIGPEKFRHSGREEMHEAAAKMRACPFA